MQTVAAASPAVWQGDGSDYNIVHTKWQINYQITGVEQFFRNIYVQEARPGEIYFDVMNQSITPLLRSLVEDAVVKAMVHYTIDEALQSIDTIPRRVQQLVQQKLDAIESGIRVVQVQLVSVKWPKQVDQAFEAYVSASQTSGAGDHAGPHLRGDDAQQGGRPGGRDAVPGACWTRTAANSSRRPSGPRPPATSRIPSRRARPTRRAWSSGPGPTRTTCKQILPEYRKQPELVLARCTWMRCRRS